MKPMCSRRVQLTQVARTQVGWPSWSLCFAISLAAYEALQHRRRVRNGLRNKVIVKEDHGWRPREAERWSQRDGDAATDDGLKAKLAKAMAKVMEAVQRRAGRRSPLQVDERVWPSRHDKAHVTTAYNGDNSTDIAWGRDGIKRAGELKMKATMDRILMEPSGIPLHQSGWPRSTK